MWYTLDLGKYLRGQQGHVFTLNKVDLGLPIIPFGLSSVLPLTATPPSCWLLKKASQHAVGSATRSTAGTAYDLSIHLFRVVAAHRF